MSVAGKKVAPKRQAAGSWRLAVVAAAMLLPVALVLFLLMARGRKAGPAPAGLPPTATVATKAATATAAVAVTATAAAVPTATPPPTASPPAVAFALGLDEAAAGANDPASLEIAGNTFALGAGRPQGGIWQPAGGEWLEGTELRRVVAVPYSADLVAAVGRLRSGDDIRLRLRSGEVVRYQVTEVARVRRHQIEVLAERRPSLVVVLYGERTGERTVVIADAVQQEEGFVVYTPVPPVSPPTPVVSETQIVTTSRVVTNEVAGLTLEVIACNRVQRVGEQQPPKTRQQFLVCSVRLRALADVAYSGQALAVTEKDWFLNAVGWWPPSVDLPTALGEGTLRAGGEVSGDVAGIVSKPALGRRSEPVLIWEQSGIQILIILE